MGLAGAENPWQISGFSLVKTKEPRKGRTGHSYRICFLNSFQFGDFLAGALYREFREVMRILTTSLGKTHRNPS